MSYDHHMTGVDGTSTYVNGVTLAMRRDAGPAPVLSIRVKHHY
jgi:hypothetical protein